MSSTGGPGERSRALSVPRLGLRLSVAGASSALAGLLLVAVGLIAGRPDVACLGAPLLLSMLWNWADRPPAVEYVAVGAAAHESEAGQIAALISVAAMPTAGAIALRVGADGYRDAHALAATGPARSIRVAADSARTGRHEVFRVDRVLGPQGGVLRTAVATDQAQQLLVLPGARLLRDLPLPHRLQGLTGVHGSRRPGDGGDLRDVNLFAPGDRLRRIDWRVTARRAGQQGGALVDLYVRRDFATADAIVMLVVDSRDEVGPDVSAWSGWRQLRPDEATSLDIAREAAASLARRYLSAGDRVGLDDLGRQSRPVAPAGGNAQLRRLTHRLAVLAPERTPKPYLRAPQVPSGSLVAVFSTFLDDEAARLAQQWRHAGHRVLAVDVLPDLLLHAVSPAVRTAFRMIQMERVDRINELRRVGVEVLRWTSSVDVDLSALARARVGRR
ncbi:MAG: hypothetical protein JWN61_2219 [Pseudonocardiales bacterium]|nr:hypothetical protein [Pseudonocardiales bacterium]